MCRRIEGLLSLDLGVEGAHAGPDSSVPHTGPPLAALQEVDADGPLVHLVLLVLLLSRCVLLLAPGAEPLALAPALLALEGLQGLRQGVRLGVEGGVEQ